MSCIAKVLKLSYCLDGHTVTQMHTHTSISSYGPVKRGLSLHELWNINLDMITKKIQHTTDASGLRYRPKLPVKVITELNSSFEQVFSTGIIRNKLTNWTPIL